MLSIHREGYKILLITFVCLLIINLLSFRFLDRVSPVIFIVLLLSLVLYVLIINFFRDPKRVTPRDDNSIYAPADGKIVTIEEVEEPEYFKDRRMQLSIFMSPIDVHVNRNPISGVVKYIKYHPGKYLVAWHPKSSTANERTTIVIENKSLQVLVRQIAGAVARRIKYYLKEGEQVVQGDELGFIKFGSRVDLLLPIDTKVIVKLGQKVTGGETLIAKLQ